MDAWLYSIISVIIVSAISLIGIVTLFVRVELLRKIILLFVSFAVGGLFGDAFIHLLPQIYNGHGAALNSALLVLAGILMFFCLEKFIRWRHCHIWDCKEHFHPAATMNLIGDGVHNLIDGMIIGASYAVNFSVGFATTLAVILHEVPQEIGDFGVLIHSGYSRKKALFLNLLSALTAIVGAVLAIVLGENIRGFSMALVPIAAGGFIYIAGSDLIPELHHEHKLGISIQQLSAIIFGIAIMALLTLIE